MKKKHYTTEQIISILKECEAAEEIAAYPKPWRSLEQIASRTCCTCSQ